MPATLRTEPVAVGSWTKRGMSAPDPRSGDFVPVESRSVQAISEEVDLELTISDEVKRGVGSGEILVRHASRVDKVFQRQQARGENLWNVDSAVRACERLLRDVAQYCLDEADWTTAAKGRLLQVVPELENPLDELETDFGEMRSHGKYTTRSEAAKETARAFAAAARIGQIVKTRYRRVPDRVTMPKLGWRLPSRGGFRAKSVAKAVERYDLKVGSWYAFAFTSSNPSRELGLNEISERLDARKEVQACERQRAQCQGLTVADTIQRNAAGQAVNGLRNRLSELERRIYEAVRNA